MSGMSERKPRPEWAKGCGPAASKPPVVGSANGCAVGDKVIATRNIWSAANEDSPMYLCAYRGDILEIRRLGSCGWACYVAHPEKEPGSMFGVEAGEIKPHNEKGQR